MHFFVGYVCLLAPSGTVFVQFAINVNEDSSSVGFNKHPGCG